MSACSGSADEPLPKYRFLWWHCDHRDHGHVGLRKPGKRLSERQRFQRVPPRAIGAVVLLKKKGGFPDHPLLRRITKDHLLGCGDCHAASRIFL